MSREEMATDYATLELTWMSASRIDWHALTPAESLPLQQALAFIFDAVDNEGHND